MLVEKEKMQNNKTLDIVEDPQTGDLLLQLTDELCKEMGWTVGDILEWIDNKDGSWSIKKKDETTTMAEAD